jgi:hypothetical protein
LALALVLVASAAQSQPATPATAPSAGTAPTATPAPTSTAAPAPTTTSTSPPPLCKQPKKTTPAPAAAAPAGAPAAPVAKRHAAGPTKVMLKAPLATKHARQQKDAFCDAAKKLAGETLPPGAPPGGKEPDAGLYKKRDAAAATLKARRSEKTPSLALVEDARSDVEALNKDIDRTKAAFDQLDPEHRGAACDEKCVEKEAKECSARKPAAPGAIAADALATTGMSWQTAFVTGLAQFLSDRAQQEVVLWLVMQLQTEICNKPETQKLFPETCALLDPACGYTDLPTGTVLASAMRADIEALPEHILVQYAHLSEVTANHIVSLFTDMRSGHSPFELIAGWSADEALVGACQSGEDRLACGMVIVGAVVASSGDATTGDPGALTLGAAPLVIEAANPIILEICKPGQPAETKETKSACKPLDPKSRSDQEKVQKLLAAVANLAKKIDQTGKSSAPAADKAVEVLNATKLVLDAGAAFFPNLPLSSAKDAKMVTVVWMTVDDTIDATTAMLSGQYAEGVRKLVAVVRDVAQDKLPDPAPRYLTLIVDISNAKTAGDVQTALNNAAAPVGSWRDKRKATSISVTGIVGVAGGWEQPISGGTKATNGNMSGGLIGAVGIDIACGIPNSNSTGGLFLSVLDVGQLISTPIAPTTTSSSGGAQTKAVAGTDFQLAQVFSPGAYARFGLGNSPFTLGFGGAFAPRLRQFETLDAKGTTTKELFSVFRANVFLAVDVTMFPLYRRAKYD